MKQWKMNSPVGMLYLVASERGLRSILFEKGLSPFAQSLEESSPEVSVLRKAVMQLTEYFAGEREDFELPLDVEGTPFQEKVWKALRRIPYGKTFSYSQLAEKIGNARATRAVGTANGRNPLCIVVPCHRVIAADGSLGGYTAGLTIKKRLLEIEQQRPL